MNFLCNIYMIEIRIFLSIITLTRNIAIYMKIIHPLINKKSDVIFLQFFFYVYLSHIFIDI